MYNFKLKKPLLLFQPNNNFVSCASRFANFYLLYKRKLKSNIYVFCMQKHAIFSLGIIRNTIYMQFYVTSFTIFSIL